MTTIDLSTPSPPPATLLDALPRRVALTLPELRLVAERAGGAPLPFEVTEPPQAAPLESRLGASLATTQDAVYRAALGALHDPETSLARRGLLAGGVVDEGLIGAVGLLATPAYAVDVDVAVTSERVQVKAWHRAGHDAVATLATADGLVFELAWFPISEWPGELARVGVLPEELALRESRVPALLDLPYELADATFEAAGTGRGDLLPVLVGRHPGSVRDGSGRPLSDAEATTILQAAATETQGRLRALVAALRSRAGRGGRSGRPSVIGVRSWVLLADGWRSLRPHTADGELRVEIRAVGPSELAADLAPVLAEVTG